VQRKLGFKIYNISAIFGLQGGTFIIKSFISFKLALFFLFLLFFLFKQFLFSFFFFFCEKNIMKTTLFSSLFVVVAVLCGAAMADVFSQLQFMKIISPTSGQSITAGEKVTIKYAMQPLVYSECLCTSSVSYFIILIIHTHLLLDHVSNGYAKSLQVNFHKRSGNTKQQQLENISPNW
jgi:hypothetical protein